MKGVARLCAVNVAVFASMLIAIEGIAGYIAATRAAAWSPWTADSRHATYDPEIGWVNEPNVQIPDMYGVERGPISPPTPQGRLPQ